MAFGRKKYTHPFKARKDAPGGSVSGGSIDDGSSAPGTRARSDLVAQGEFMLKGRARLAQQALTHPSVAAPVFFFATEFGRMPWLLEQEGERYTGAAPSWLERPLPRNPSYTWKRFQTAIGFELELFGEVGLRVATMPSEDPEDRDMPGPLIKNGNGRIIASVKPVSARRFVTLGDASDPSYIVYPLSKIVQDGGRARRARPSPTQYEVLTPEENEDGVFFLHLTTMTDAEGLVGLSPYTLADATIYSAGFARLQKSRFWQRDGRKLFGAKNIDPVKKIADEEWETTKKNYKKSLQVKQDDPADVPLFAKEWEMFELDETMKNSQGVEFAEFWSSQLAMLGRIPEMLVRMSHKSNPNYKIIRAIYQFYVANRIAPALEDLAGVLRTLLAYEESVMDIRFDLTDALRADLETLVATFRQAKGLPLFSGEEMQKLAGFQVSDEPGMDKHFSDIQTVVVERLEDLTDSMIEKNYGLGAKSEQRAKTYANGS